MAVRRVAHVKFAPCLVLFFAGATSLWPQSFNATLQGTIVDSTGAVVADAPVSLVNEATNVSHTTRSNERGRYFFSPLSPGVYRLSVEVAGFKAFVRSAMELQVQQQATVDVQLSPGDLLTKIEVSGEAPRLETANATLGRVIENRYLLDMPGMRKALELAFLAPGVAGIRPDTRFGQLGSTGTNFVSGGSRNSTADILVDGVTSTVHEPNGGVTQYRAPLSSETVQEFKVDTNSFSAEFGNTAGTVVNMVTRSGTNQLHGSLFHFHRNSAFKANDFFSNRVGKALPAFRLNQFGGAIGGPVWIPYLYNGRNRTFFFFHHEGTKTATAASMTATVPTELERAGDFSQSFDARGRLIRIYDPFSIHKNPTTNRSVRDPFPGNAIPVNRMDRVAVKAASYYPQPTGPGVGYTHQNNFFNSGTNIANSYQETIKLDHHLTDRSRLSIRYSRLPGSTLPANLWGNFMYPLNLFWYNNKEQGAAADYTHTLTPSTVLTVRWGLVRFGPAKAGFGFTADYWYFNDPDKWPYWTTQNPWPQLFGFQGPLPIENAPQFAPEGYTAVGPQRGSGGRWAQDMNHVTASLSRSAGIAVIKLGVDARFQRNNWWQPGRATAGFSFGRITTTLDPLVPDSLQGNGFASMLLGWGTSGSREDAAVSGYSCAADQGYSFYVTNDIRVTPRLTLNLGLRYELDVPFTDRWNRLGWLDLNARLPLTAPGLSDLRGGVVFTDSQHRRTFDMEKNNVAPRFGWAYKVLPRVVVRGGYGIYYGISTTDVRKFLGPGFGARTPWLTSLDSGFTRYASLTYPFADGITPAPGRSLGLATNVGGSVTNADVRSWGVKPYYQQWSLAVQRELPANSVVEVAYIGNRGVHLQYGGSERDLNRLDPQYYVLGDKLRESVSNPFYGLVEDPTSALSKPQITRLQLLRPYPQFTQLIGYTGPPKANSVYHAAQIKFTKRFSHGLAASAHYTFSKLIDDNSDLGNLGWLGGATSQQAISNLRLERSLSIFDFPHRAVIDFAYALPLGRGRTIGNSWNRWIDAVLGAWQVNGIVLFQSGAVLQPGLSGGVLPDSTQRPNLLSDPKRPGSVVDRLGGYLNADAFSRPAPYTLGNAPRTLTSPRAPLSKNTDLSLFKNLYLTRDRRVYLQIRGEAFNATNTPVFGAPNVNWGSTAFGIIGSQANSPRELQVSAKIYF